MSIPPPPGPHQPEGPSPQPGPYPHQPGPHPQGPGPYAPGPYPQDPYQHSPYQQSPYQQAPYGQPPYPAWGQGYSPYNRPAPVNGLAISSLVLGILCCLPGVGLALGLVALRQIKRRGERGRGLAIGGSVLSGLGLGLWVLMLATGGAGAFWEGVKEGARDNVVFTLSKGECVNAPGGSLHGETYDLDTVDCDGEHDAEVFASYDLPGGSYPGQEALDETAGDRCYGLQDGYAMDAWAVPDDVDVYYLVPTTESWSIGDRAVTCLFGNTVEGEPLTGSLRNDETVLDADQVAYLKAAHVLNAALDAAPDAEYVEDDLPGHRAWARRVSTALDEQTGMLRGHDWPKGASGPVAALADDLDKARAQWSKAAGSGDVDTFYEHYEKGYDLLDPKRSVTARKALGLATTPPSEADGGSGTGGGGGGTGMEV
ncbi:DUF4190 domain-containing protein [Streptomyces sp. NPDC004629]|uniref:DUF4190 domain-containing protein n=1 Tax=Streptomyces sp. NPDC004629 TaxID=3364705 RepID=UPI0036A1C3EC